jgi:uncharacterized protein (TIGR03437 family)
VGSISVFAQTPVIDSVKGVQNGASFAPGQAVAPGSLVSLFGSNLANSQALASTIPISTKLGTTTVTFNGIPAPLSFVRGDQINAQVPWELSGTSAQVVVTNGSSSSSPLTASLAPAGPGIFAYCVDAPACTNNLAIAYGNLDYQFAWTAGSIAGVTTHAAKINDQGTLVILATGLGAVSPSIPTGDIPPAGKFSSAVTTPTVTVGGVPAQVVFTGIVGYVGVFQINIIIQPGTPTGPAVPVQITVNGVKSNAPTIAVTN